MLEGNLAFFTLVLYYYVQNEENNASAPQSVKRNITNYGVKGGTVNKASLCAHITAFIYLYALIDLSAWRYSRGYTAVTRSDKIFAAFYGS